MNFLSREGDIGTPRRSLGGASRFRRRIWHILSRRAAFLLIVLGPSLISAIYLWGFAADQYISDARFTVRQGTQESGASSLIGILGVSASSIVQSESYAVSDYLTSHDAVQSLRARFDLVAMYRRPEADILMRLWWSQPSAEDLLNYFERMVSVSFDTQSGSAHLRVRAFRATDARDIAEALLQLGEARVNTMTVRAEQDTLRVAGDAVRRGEARVEEAQEALTAFRLKQQILDPSKSAATLLGVVGTLESRLASARSQLAADSKYLSPESPQYRIQSNQIQALERQIDAETERLTGDGKSALAPILASYERKLLEREFAEKEYTIALTSLEAARNQVLKQHLFVSRVVEPNLPEDSTFPKRWLFMVTEVCVLLLAYGIGWLILAGAREHAA